VNGKGLFWPDLDVSSEGIEPLESSHVQSILKGLGNLATTFPVAADVKVHQCRGECKKNSISHVRLGEVV